MRRQIREILASVSKPYRYAGGEVGEVRKEWDACRVRLCLAFPDAYEIGMSHTGLAILYHLINAREGWLAGRAFAPWADMETALRSRGMPLFSLENQRPLADFDLIGISLGYELTATNALNILDLAGLPLRAADRDERHPLVIAGGPCAFNPMPMAAFFDAVVIGDGEEAICEIARAIEEAKGEGRGAKGTALPRQEMLERLRAIEGVYVPQLPPDEAHPLKLARVLDLDAAPFPTRPINAYAATQERVAVEVARGCTRGCRFCQAGYAYRPLRQRSAANAAALAAEGIGATGKEEFSFLSLSIGDWDPLEAALGAVHGRCGGMPVNATLPSLRVESLTQPVIDLLGGARAGSFTLAPEAGTERMRAFINKGNADADLYASVEKIFAGGWHAIKLYFMLGLPGETAEELDAIVAVANACLEIGRRHHKRPDVTVSTSTFIPKPHTPFQWEAQIGVAETERLQGELKRRLRRPGLYYRWHDARMSWLEGVLARGGAELSDAIELAFRMGARFDGWDECFDAARWQQAFAESGIDCEAMLAARPTEAMLPWERLGIGPSRGFLLCERQAAMELRATGDCAHGACTACGICDPEKGLINRLASRPDPRITDHRSLITESRSPIPDPRSPITPFRYRLRFEKLGRAAFLGHLEALDALRRGLRAAGLPLLYSEGYHPRARVAAGPALPVGVESLAEYADIELSAALDPDAIVRSASGRLPEGMAVREASAIDARAPAIEAVQASVRYEVDLERLPEGAASALAVFTGSAPIPVRRERKGKASEVDARPHIAALAETQRGVLGITLRSLTPALKVSEVLQALLGVTDAQARALPVRKIAVEWKENESQSS